MSLRGKLVFAEGHVLGRATALLMPGLVARAWGASRSSAVDASLASELRWMISHFRLAAPRMLFASDPRPPVLIFTDAFLDVDTDDAGIGGVLFDGSYAAYFSERVGSVHLQMLQHDTKQVIAVMEALPVLIARLAWEARLLHRRAFYFIDNDAARSALIKGHSSASTINLMLKRDALLAAATPSFPWYSRVPSAINIADEPSRLRPVRSSLAATDRSLECI
jgi:hypothetical protein